MVQIMPSIQIIPLNYSSTSMDSVLVANYLQQVYPEESAWKYSDGDLVVGGYVPARAGAWVSRFNLLDTDIPPLAQLKYDESAANDASIVIETAANKAYLRISNIDLNPDPKNLFPDIHWEVNGLDLIPRGE
jgi:hypothetical protein